MLLIPAGMAKRAWIQTGACSMTHWNLTVGLPVANSVHSVHLAVYWETRAWRL
jgi:hypothetical protein